MEKQTMYVFTVASTTCLGIEGVKVFSTEEKARQALEDFKNSSLENGCTLEIYNGKSYCQILDEDNETWTAEITETYLDE